MGMIDVGQVVVCVNGRFDDPIAKAIGLKVPVVGGVYTVRDIINDYTHGGVGLLLAEVVNRPILCLDRISVQVAEPSFNIIRFRPAKETDISVFEGLLIKQPEVA